MPKPSNANTKDVGARELVKASLEKLPPYNLDAEYCILGAILLDNTAFYTAMQVYKPGMFYRKTNEVIFLSMRALIESGEHIDLIMLRDKLEESHKDLFTKIPLETYLAQIVDATPTAANIESHIKIIKEKWIARRILTASTIAALACYDEAHEKPLEILSTLQQELLDIEMGTVASVASPVVEIIEHSEEKLREFYDTKGKITGIPLGLRNVDELVMGYQKTDLVVIAARPSKGKSALALLGAVNQAKAGFPAVYFTPELSKLQVGIRLVCMENKINVKDIRRGKVNPRDLEHEANLILKKLPLYIDDTTELTTTQLRAKVLSLISMYGIQSVFIDYLTLMKTGTRADHDERLKMNEIARATKALAKDANVVVFDVSQLNRSVELTKSRRPELHHLRETGIIEEVADIVHFIYWPESYGLLLDSRKGQSEIITAKNRNGETGSCWTRFIKDYTLFENLHTDQPPPPAMDSDEQYFNEPHEAPPHPATAQNDLPLHVKQDDQWYLPKHPIT